MSNLIEQLAKEMNTNVHDLKLLANVVAGGIKADGIAEFTLNASEEDAQQIVEAYIPAAVRKIKSISTKLNTCPQAKKELMSFILNAA